MPDPQPDPLWRHLAAGDERSFAVLYDRFGARLYRVARKLLGSSQDAEDAVQELFVALVRSQKRLAGVEDLEAYLFASLRRMAYRFAAARQRRPMATDPAFFDVAACNHVPSLGDADWCLEWALGCLPPEQREVVALKLDGGLTFAQIGQVLGTSANTAASRYRYALEKLRAAVEKEK